MNAPQINLLAYKRVPLNVSIPEMGVDYTGATLLCEIRQLPGGIGSPLVSLTNATPPAEGVSVEYRADFEDPEGELPAGASLVRIMIAESTLEGLPYATNPEDPVVLYYDIHITPEGESKFIFCAGTLEIRPGVTL